MKNRNSIKLATGYENVLENRSGLEVAHEVESILEETQYNGDLKEDLATIENSDI